MKKGLNRTLSVISKIAEIAAWIGVVAGLIAFAGSFNKDVAQEIVAGKSEMLQSVGFELGVITSTGVINYFALSMYYLGTVIAFVLIALIFRNLDIILYTISGRYEKAESSSPFQKDVVKRVKNIGILSIAMPVFAFVLTAIVYVVSLINGTPVGVSVSLEGVIIGLVCLCLTQIFSYGAKLEEEVDGLL